MAWAISSSSAPMTGAVAAMALPPQMEEPTPMRVEMLRVHVQGPIEDVGHDQAGGDGGDDDGQ